MALRHFFPSDDKPLSDLLSFFPQKTSHVNADFPALYISVGITAAVKTNQFKSFPLIELNRSRIAGLCLQNHRPAVLQNCLLLCYGHQSAADALPSKALMHPQFCHHQTVAPLLRTGLYAGQQSPLSALCVHNPPCTGPLPVRLIELVRKIIFLRIMGYRCVKLLFMHVHMVSLGAFNDFHIKVFLCCILYWYYGSFPLFFGKADNWQVFVHAVLLIPFFK